MKLFAVDPHCARLQRKAELRDPATASHMRRVSQYAGLIAAGLGLGAAAVEEAVAACALHDIGKLNVPHRLLQKEAPLSAEELRVMRLHVHYGQAMLLDTGSPLGRTAAAIALHHHEKFDGSGYPFGLRGASIPLYARLAAVADVFDALTSRRPQRCALGFDFALEYVRRQGGLHFDPDCVAAFVTEERRILEIRRRFPDGSEEVEERKAGQAQV